MLRAAVLDAKGVPVPTAGNAITFKVLEGPAAVIGVGNGDPSSHESDKAVHRSAFNGLARCIIQAGVFNQSGVVTVQATSPGLAPSTLDIKLTVP